MVEQGNVRHAFKTQWDWTIPVGRGQRFGANMNAILEAILGGWSMNGVGRVQARTLNLGNVRLVNMTVDELTDLYKYEIRPNASGVPTVYALPEDIILNTRRALSIDPRTPTGHSATLGLPEGKYIAPANSADCIEIRNGDCAPGAVIIRTPFFTRFDIGVTKRFPLKGSDELRAAARHAQRVRQHQLQPGRPRRQPPGVRDVGEPVPGDERLSRSETTPTIRADASAR